MLKEFENNGCFWLRTFSNRMITIERNGRYVDLCFLGNRRNNAYQDNYDFNGTHYYHRKYFDEPFT